MTHRILVIGGYGNFGARICRALAGDSQIDLVVAGRDGKRALEFAHSIGAGESVDLDHGDPSLAEHLRRLRIDTLIHAAGPFQHQGYRVALAAAAAGANYLDLSDGRRFVCDFAEAANAAFVRAGRAGISGASTLPGLSSAVVRHLCMDWARIDTIDVCIAPAQTAPRGIATLQAVLDYCGEEVLVWDDGRWRPVIGWGNPQPVAVRGLAPRVGAVCDVPDLELLPGHFQVGKRVEFRAALEVPFTQRAFAVLASMRSRRLLPRLGGLAAIVNRFSTAFDRFGSARGGMAVRVAGLDASGRPSQRSWHVIADDDHGPEIPCMATILLARSLSRGPLPQPGAYPCVELLPLAAFEPEFRRWGMITETVDES